NRIAIVTDFLGDADALLEQARLLLARGTEVFAVHVIAREELDPRDLGTLVVDPEEASVRRPLDEAGLAEYKRAFTSWCDELASSWRAEGAVYQRAVTGEPADRIIRQIVTPLSTSDASATRQ